MFCHNINIQMVFYLCEFFHASLYSDFLQISCHNMNMHKVFLPVYVLSCFFKSWFCANILSQKRTSIMFFTSVRPNDFERKKLESTRFKSKRDQTFFQLYFFAFLWEVRITNITFVKSSFLHALTNILHTSYFPLPEVIWSGVSPLSLWRFWSLWFQVEPCRLLNVPKMHCKHI